MPDPAIIVQAQLDAYNARDIDAFAATFTDDAVAYDLDSNTRRFAGMPALRERCGAQFVRCPAQRSLVVSRNVVGLYVFDLELITGTVDDAGRPAEPYTLMAVYRVRGPGGPGAGLIEAMWFTPRAGLVPGR
ncbi:MAG: nuclear transport factor 2 family protein [Planctomycetaceae bacterium]|jgi:hypothetical protein|nr:nuclear transport factor 2 family protein [Phycisphaerales bacterium]MCE2652898.1 nuclear transport factor 2 family protein [Planctomycetaceae bacterium]